VHYPRSSSLNVVDFLIQKLLFPRPFFLTPLLELRNNDPSYSACNTVDLYVMFFTKMNMTLCC
jgi:hypothetical protein